MSLTELETAAALAEEGYRRDPKDQQLADQGVNGANGIGVGGVQLSPTVLSGTNLKSGGDAFYYDDTTGFAGRVVTSGNTVFVVFRGTDMAGGLDDLLDAELGWGASDKVDLRDLPFGNQALGFGTSGQSQFNDALALTQAAQASFPGLNVVVVGQSLGGGLAGLVSATLGLKSYLIDPAPFQNQLAIQATLNAVPNSSSGKPYTIFERDEFFFREFSISLSSTRGDV